MASRQFKHLSMRRDLDVIARMVPEQSRVLDLGCGDGAFLKRLQQEKQVQALGLEISPALIGKCIANGVPVIQRNLDESLDFAEDGSFDIVLLSHTLQELQHPEKLLAEIVRVGKTAIVSFINFGHYSCRLQLLFGGRMPRSRMVPYEWYNTPNIHLATLADFHDLCAKLNIEIISERALGLNWDAPVKIWHNLLAPGGVFELRRGETDK